MTTGGQLRARRHGAGVLPPERGTGRPPAVTDPGRRRSPVHAGAGWRPGDGRHRRRPGCRRRRAPSLAGAALGTLTLGAYLPGLGRSLDFDGAETIGLFVRPGPPWTAFQRQAVFNNHPLFSFLEQLVRVATGRTDAATMRLLPILFGALTVGVLTWFSARRYGVPAGLVGGAVVAANPTFVALSRAPRGYSLLTLCALVSTVLVLGDGDGHGRARGRGVAYVAFAAAGLATHLYMLLVLAAHVGIVIARRRLDERWRARFVAVAVLGALAYAGMSRAMLEAGEAHARVFQPSFPWRVALMASGGGRVAPLVAPLVLVGAAIVVRGRAARAAAVASGAVFVALWAGLRSAALSERFLVWLVPAAGHLAAAAVAAAVAAARERRPPSSGDRARRPALAVTAVTLATAGVAVAVVGQIPGYTADPTGYRRAAALIRAADRAGGRACVVDVGAPPMAAYLDSPRQFTAVTEPRDLDGCDVVVVAAWWRSSRPWFEADNRVIAAAEARYPNRLVIPAGDPALVLSNRPL